MRRKASRARNVPLYNVYMASNPVMLASVRREHVPIMSMAGPSLRLSTSLVSLSTAVSAGSLSLQQHSDPRPAGPRNSCSVVEAPVLECLLVQLLSFA